MADLSPPENGNLTFILINSYSENLQLRRPGGRSTPPENGNLTFILIDSYSDSSGRPGGRSSGRSIPLRKWQFDIHTDRFLL